MLATASPSVGGLDAGCCSHGSVELVGLWHFWVKIANFWLSLTIKTPSPKNKTIYKRF
jgi:hypothetical protein